MKKNQYRAGELFERADRDELTLPLRPAADLLNLQRLRAELASEQPLSQNDRDTLMGLIDDHPVLIGGQRIRAELASDRSLSRNDRDALMCLIDDYPISIGRGRPEGPGDELQLYKQCAVRLFQIRCREYRAMHSPSQRIRNKEVRKQIAQRAIQLVQRHQPGVQITVDDLLDFKGRITHTVRDYVAEHFPDARHADA